MSCKPLLLSVLGALLCAACATPLSETAGARAEGELGCDSVDLSDLGNGAYEASGCGQTATFACETNGGHHGIYRNFCVREGEVHADSSGSLPDIPAASKEDPNADRAALYSTVLSAATSAGEQCSEQSGPHGAGEARVTFAASGRVANVSIDERFDASSTGSCVQNSLRRVLAASFKGAPISVNVPFFIDAKKNG